MGFGSGRNAERDWIRLSRGGIGRGYMGWGLGLREQSGAGVGWG